MPLTYGKLINNIAVRLGEAGSLVGSNMTTQEANFNQATITSSHIDNVRFHLSAQRAAILLAEERMAHAAASTKIHPYRIFLRGVSDALVSRATLPFQDSSGDDIVGVIGAVKGFTDSAILTETNLEEVERVNRLRVNALKCRQHLYARDGATIVHTDNGTVTVEVCKYNRTTQKEAIAGDLETLFPDACEETYICGALAYMFTEDEAPETLKPYIENFWKTIEKWEAGKS